MNCSYRQPRAASKSSQRLAQSFFVPNPTPPLFVAVTLTILPSTRSRVMDPIIFQTCCFLFYRWRNNKITAQILMIRLYQSLSLFFFWSREEKRQMHAWRERKWHDGCTKAWLIDMGWPHHHDSPFEQNECKLPSDTFYILLSVKKGVWNKKIIRDIGANFGQGSPSFWNFLENE